MGIKSNKKQVSIKGTVTDVSYYYRFGASGIDAALPPPPPYAKTFAWIAPIGSSLRRTPFPWRMTRCPKFSNLTSREGGPRPWFTSTRAFWTEIPICPNASKVIYWAKPTVEQNRRIGRPVFAVFQLRLSRIWHGRWPPQEL